MSQPMFFGAGSPSTPGVENPCLCGHGEARHDTRCLKYGCGCKTYLPKEKNK